ncbi:MAG: fatty acid desaturase, partial [Pseudobdellovibrionaceae bacterium]
MRKEAYATIRKNTPLKIKATRLWTHVFADTALVSLIASLVISFNGSFVQYLAIPLIATFMFRSFSLMHESVHGVTYKNKFVNDFFGVLYGSLNLLPYEQWKKTHLEHHFWSGNIEKDPVMTIVRQFPAMNSKTKRFLNTLWVLWIPMLAFLQYGVFWYASLGHYFKGQKSLRNVISLFSPIFVWTTILALAPLQISLTVLAPAVVLYMIAVEVINFPHHLGLPQSKGDAKLPAWEQ